MNLTAHPLAVAAELAWKQESLGHANTGRSRTPRRRTSVLGLLPWRRRPGRGSARPARPTRPTPRPA